MKPLERIELLERIAGALQDRFTTSQINALLSSFGITEGLEEVAKSKRVYARERLAALDHEKLIDLARDLDLDAPAISETETVATPSSDARTVFVIHGRDEFLRQAMFSFLRAAGLDPLEWSEAVQLTGSAAPYIGDVLDRAFERASAVVVLLTPDDLVHLAPRLRRPNDGADELEVRGQARPNVLFEAGMAFGRHPDRTVLVTIGEPKAFSDVGGRHLVRLDNRPENRAELVERLRNAGCAVKTDGRRDWYSVGDFSLEAPSQGGSLPVRVPSEEIEPNLDVLEVVASHETISAKDTAGALNLTRVAAEYHLEQLKDAGYLHDLLSRGGPTRYTLSQRGRAALVEAGLA